MSDTSASRLEALLQLKKEVERIKDLPPREQVFALTSVVVVPPDTERRAYTVLREIYLERFNALFTVVFASDSYATGREWGDAVLMAQKNLEQIEVWLRPPMPPLTPEAALKMVEGTKSELWRNAVLKGIGKRRNRGQPPSKRHLAVQALDVKCAAPKTSLAAATDLLCPCGKDMFQHTGKCKEQLRQQINGLVKLFRKFGYDFTWDRLTHSGGKYSLIPSTGK